MMMQAHVEDLPEHYETKPFKSEGVSHSRKRSDAALFEPFPAQRLQHQCPHMIAKHHHMNN
jgi:hypothetical protein